MKKNNLLKQRDIFKKNMLDGASFSGKYEMPCLNATQIKILTALPFNVALYIPENERKNNNIHFYIDDYQFERVWNSPQKYVEFLKQFKTVIAPDFSLYTDLPKMTQLWNLFRSRALAYFWQKNGVNVIPNVTWSNKESFEFCFDGLPKNSTIALSSVGCTKNPTALLNFCEGYLKACEILEPTNIIFYGKIPESLKNDTRIIHIQTYAQIHLQNLIKGDKI